MGDKPAMVLQGRGSNTFYEVSKGWDKIRSLPEYTCLSILPYSKTRPTSIREYLNNGLLDFLVPIEFTS